MSRKLNFSLFVLLLVAIIANILFTVISRYIIHDVFVHLDIASRLLEGAKPYVDYIETNFPTAHYLHIPPVWLANVTEYDVITTFHIYMFVIVLLCVGHVIDLINKHPEEFKQQRPILSHAFGILILCAGFLLTDSFGQREHIFMLMFIPLIILSWTRWYPTVTINPIFAGMLGFLAGIALTIKPYFFLMMGVVLIFDGIKRKTWRLWNYAEYQGLALAGIFYIGFALLNWESTYAFIFEQMGETIRNYSSYGGGANVLQLMFEVYLVETLTLIGLLVMAWGMYRSKPDVSALTLYFACLMIVALLTVILQDKGWPYHFVPYRIFGLLGLAILVFYALPIQQIKLYRWLQVGVLTIWLMILLSHSQWLQLTDPDLWIAEEYSQEDDPILGVFTHTWFSPYSILAERQNVTTHLTAHPIPFELTQFNDVSEVYAGGMPYLSDEIQKYLDILQRDIETRQPVLIYIEEECFVCPTGVYISHYLDDIGFIDDVMGDSYQLILEQPRFVVYQRVESID
jgi:hypothetical protein